MGKDVIIALDFDSKEKTLAFLDRFPGRKPFVKIGMELYYAEGPAIVREIKARGHKIFLDLKLHDIPNTVKKAMAVLCPGCFQPETWSFSYGQPFTNETIAELLRLLAPGYIAGLTLLGGEPFEPENLPAVLALLRRVRAELPRKTVWAFSGYTYDQLTARTGEAGKLTSAVLDLVDVLVDGKFVEAKKNLRLRFRGSENQRILDLVKTRETGELTLWDDGDMEGH